MAATAHQFTNLNAFRATAGKLIPQDRLPARISIFSVNVFGELCERHWSDAREEATAAFNAKHYPDRNTAALRASAIRTAYEFPETHWIVDERNAAWDWLWKRPVCECCHGKGYHMEFGTYGQREREECENCNGRGTVKAGTRGHLF